MRERVMQSAVLSLVLAASACATAPPASAPAASETPRSSFEMDSSEAAERTWEPWPPPEAARPSSGARGSSPSGETITLEPKPAPGWAISDLFEYLSRTTGQSIVYDSGNATLKQARVEFVGKHVIDKSELFAWVQAVLSSRKLVLVPVGPKSAVGAQQWFVMDQADPNLRSRPLFLDESEVFDYADRDGLYVTTLLRLRDTVDSTRVRNALSPLSTATAGIGRLQDIPGRWMIVSDFAPVVAAMKQMLDRINAGTPPSAFRPPPAQAPASK